MQKSFKRAAVLAVLLSGVSSQAVTYGFNRITNNGSEDPAGQFSVNVVAGPAGKVNFEFKNNVGLASVISEIYWDDNSANAAALLGGGPVIITETGVDFNVGGSPADLPAGNSITPKFEANWRVTAKSPSPSNGINSATDLLSVQFGLGSFADLNALLAALDAGTFRIGLHVQAIGTGGKSESFVNTPPVRVPDTGGTLLLLGGGLLALAAARRRDRVA